MKYRVYNLSVLLSSLFGYLQWGDTQNAFLIELELEIFKKALTNPEALLNPIILVPLIGQVLLILAVLYKRSHKYLTYIGILALGILFCLIFYAGILSKRYWIPASTLPFFISSILTLRHYQKI